MSPEKQTEDLKNIFTAYLAKAVWRRRRDYLNRQTLYQKKEYLQENSGTDVEETPENLWLEELPLLQRIENDVLFSALKTLTEREQDIFFSRVLGNRSFDSIAAKYGMTYKGVSTAYYRVIRKSRKLMEE